MTAHDWVASENPIVEPYSRGDKALGGVRFRTHLSEEPSEEPARWFDDTSLPTDFRPELTLSIDPDRCESDSGVPSSDLQISVIVRDRAIKRWEVVGSWKLGQHPETFEPPVTDGGTYATGRWMEFTVVVTPASELPKVEGRASLPTEVIAERTFSVRIRRDGSRFSIGEVEEKWFVENGMPKSTVWAIDWMDHDVTKEAITCVAVYVNKNHFHQLQGAFAGDQGKVIAAQTSVEIFTEVAALTIRLAEEFHDEPNSLIGLVLGKLDIATKEDFDAMKSQLVSSDERRRVSVQSIIRGRVQAALGLGRLVNAVKGA